MDIYTKHQVLSAHTLYKNKLDRLCTKPCTKTKVTLSPRTPWIYFCAPHAKQTSNPRHACACFWSTPPACCMDARCGSSTRPCKHAGRSHKRRTRCCTPARFCLSRRSCFLSCISCCRRSRRGRSRRTCRRGWRCRMPRWCAPGVVR